MTDPLVEEIRVKMERITNLLRANSDLVEETRNLRQQRNVALARSEALTIALADHLRRAVADPDIMDRIERLLLVATEGFREPGTAVVPLSDFLALVILAANRD